MWGASRTEPLSCLHLQVGSNGHLEIDFGIDRHGSVDPVHAVAYKQFGDWIRSCYGSPVGAGALTPGSTTLEITFAAATLIDRVRLEEDQTKGQLVVSYAVEAKVGGKFVPFSEGITIGAKRIDIAKGGAVTATGLKVTVLSGFGKPTGLKAFAFASTGLQDTSTDLTLQWVTPIPPCDWRRDGEEGHRIGF